MIRGSATNQDGASNGLTAPNGPAQERVIRQALANAGLSPAEVDAVEAHGTGTVLGDPIEAQAILATYGQNREQPLYLGSIKSNIGHTQAAAGVAGVIKMALAMRHGALPRTLHLCEPTPHVDWSAGEVELLREARPWQANGRPRRAGVSSFGASGTNAHLILEEPPALDREGGENGGESGGEAPASEPLPVVPLLLSAKGEDALRAQGERLGAHLRHNPELELAAVAAGLAARPQLPHRAVAIGAEREQLLEALDALAQGEPSAALLQGQAGAGKLAFLFGGQGRQWPGMGRELLEESPVFAAHLRACEEALEPHVDFSVEQVLRQGRGEEPVEVIQPVLFATMVSLAGLWRSYGVEPAAVAGHSQGEIAAAHVAGALSLEDAARVVALRSRLLTEVIGRGGMVALRLSPQLALEKIEPWGARLELAAQNSPVSSVVGGDPDALEELIEACKKADIRTRNLGLGGAGHTSHVEAIRERLLADLAPIEPRTGERTFYSSMTGGPLDGRELGAEYWYRATREPVRFEQVTAALLGSGFDSFVEISVHPALTMAVEETAAVLADAPASIAASGSLRRGEGGIERFAVALAEAHVGGAKVDWPRLLGAHERVPLPTYPFQRQRFWLESSQGASEPAAIGQGDPAHPLLGALIALPAEEGWLLTGRLSLQSHPWLADHAVHAAAILPGTGFLELALQGAAQAGAESVEELTLGAPLVLPEQGAVQIQVRVGEEEEQGKRPLTIHSRPDADPDAEWLTNASGTLAGPAGAPPEALTEWPPPGAEAVEVGDFYAQVAELGVDYGPAFQGLKAAWRRGSELFAEVELGPEQAEEAERFALHPALSDAALHPVMLLGEADAELRVPFAWSGVSLSGAGAQALRVRLEQEGDDITLALADAAGTPVASVQSISARPIDPAHLQAATPGIGGSLFSLQWKKLALPADPEPDPRLRHFPCTPAPDLDPPAAAQALCEQVLAELQAAIAEPEAETKIAFITQGALPVEEGESPDLAAAAACGLVRSAQAEHPGRFTLLDTDAGAASQAAIEAALAIATEPQLALREGQAFASRLAPAPQPEAEPRPFDPNATVLITGGTGTLGALFARHLVSAYGVSHLLLASRRGAEAPGAAQLQEELAALGATVEIRACDVADPEQLAALVGSVSPEHPLGAIIHSAGATDDGLIDSLDPERLQGTFAPKATAAWHLHQLSREIEGCELISFSSVAGTLQSPGQGNYAAANAFLDALAQARQGEGLAGCSLGWGLWAARGGGSEETPIYVDLARASRDGLAEMPTLSGLDLFDRARALPSSYLVAAKLDAVALRSLARDPALPPLLRGLVRSPARRAGGDAGTLATRLASASADEREGLVLDLVRSHVATLLGHASGQAIDPQAAFKDLGFDSLAAVELRNQLGRATGLRLPASLAFDFPTAAAVAKFLLDQVEGTETPADTDRKLDSIVEILDSVVSDERERALARLQSLLSGFAGGDRGEGGSASRVDLDSASDEELLALIDGEFGRS